MFRNKRREEKDGKEGGGKNTCKSDPKDWRKEEKRNKNLIVFEIPASKFGGRLLVLPCIKLLNISDLKQNVKNWSKIINHTIHLQSFDQSIKQSINQSICRSIDQLTDWMCISARPAIHQSINQSIKQASKQATYQPFLRLCLGVHCDLPLLRTY